MTIAHQMELLGSGFTQTDALDFFNESNSERGEVFTRREVVEFILEISRWGEGCEFQKARLLEPSAGSGDFLIPAVERLLAAKSWTIPELQDRIRAVEVNGTAFRKCRDRVEQTLKGHGFNQAERQGLMSSWLIHGDFLTARFSGDFTHVVGNPPYVRQEALPPELLKLYRSRFATMYDRADLYIPFFEKSLTLLAPGGCLGFICADRWMKNKYGGPLREMVSRGFHLESYVDFTGCPAFHEEVVAYPAVTVIRRQKGKLTRTASRPEIDSSVLGKLAKHIVKGTKNEGIVNARDVVSGSEPWLLDNPARLDVIRDLEARFPRLEEAGCRVGIGVATGIDSVYIRSDEELPVEKERKLPIAMTKDIVDGEIKWGGKMLLNPFDGDTSRLVNTTDFPLFNEYLESNRDAISRRHVAKKNPNNWFKTIDRIYPSLAKTPKLLIPDIKGEAAVVYDPGELYPHHNFYYVVSDEWDLHALQAILLSAVTQAFISTYSLKMRGDCLRYQAQYLRRVRLPIWKSLDRQLQRDLREAGRKRDKERIADAVRKAYELGARDWQTLSSR